MAERSNGDGLRESRLAAVAKHYFGSDDPQLVAAVLSNMKRASMAQRLYNEARQKRKLTDINSRVDVILKNAEEFAESEGVNIDEMSENPQFLKYMANNGLSVRDAYYLANREDALRRAREELTASILSKKERISENAADAQAARRKMKKGAAELSGEDIDEILKRVRRGEKISF